MYPRCPPVLACHLNFFTEVCSGSEGGSYLMLIDFVYHSTLGLRVIQKKKFGVYVEVMRSR